VSLTTFQESVTELQSKLSIALAEKSSSDSTIVSLKSALELCEQEEKIKLQDSDRLVSQLAILKRRLSEVERALELSLEEHLSEVERNRAQGFRNVGFLHKRLEMKSKRCALHIWRSKIMKLARTYTTTNKDGNKEQVSSVLMNKVFPQQLVS
jgi:RecA/RadA recombinase